MPVATIQRTLKAEEANKEDCKSQLFEIRYSHQLLYLPNNLVQYINVYLQWTRWLYDIVRSTDIPSSTTETAHAGGV